MFQDLGQVSQQCQFRVEICLTVARPWWRGSASGIPETFERPDGDARGRDFLADSLGRCALGRRGHRCGSIKSVLSLTSGIDELFGQVFEGSGDSTDYKKLRIAGDVTSM